METNATFGADPVDQFSEPLSIRSTLFGQVVTMARRERPDSDRSLGVVWDARRPMIPGFDNCYSYVVRFKWAGAVAANHYHRHKDELFHAVSGSFRIVLANVGSGTREEIFIDSTENTFVHVPRTVAHAIQALDDNAALLTLANHPNLDADVIAHPLVEATRNVRP